MSMLGKYVRLAPAELDRVVADAKWAEEFVWKLAEAEDERRPELPRARCLETDKAWGGLAFLTQRAGFPVDVVHGAEAVPWENDWGYGPPRYLTPEQVRLAAGALAATSGAHLVAGVTPADLAAENVYPTAVWERGEPLDWVVAYYELLGGFVAAAAEAGDAVLLWVV